MPRLSAHGASGRTRERILETSLAMFNAHGEPNVTTNHIAEEAGISPGNLYYHFRSKSDIVEQLFGAYEVLIDQALLLPAARRPNLEDLWLQLHLLFEAISRYRFLHRDLVDILSRNRRIRTRFARLLQRATASAQALLTALAATGVMHATAPQINALVESMILQTTFWLGYEMVRDSRYDGSAGDAGRGITHIIGLLIPYLDESERRHLAAIGAAYAA